MESQSNINPFYFVTLHVSLNEVCLKKLAMTIFVSFFGICVKKNMYINMTLQLNFNSLIKVELRRSLYDSLF